MQLQVAYSRPQYEDLWMMFGRRGGARPVSATRENVRSSGAGKIELSPVQQDLLCEQMILKELTYYQPYTTFFINPLKPG